MTPAKLPLPLSALQGAVATEETQLRQIFPVLADAIGCTLPEVEFSEFISVVKEFETTTQKIEALAEKTPIASSDELTPDERLMLAETARQIYSPIEAANVYRVFNELEKCNRNRLAANLAQHMLSRKNVCVRRTA
jgi:hypothetical protein